MEGNNPMKRDARIDLGLPTETKLVIERAATISNVTVSDFILTHATAAAHHVIADHLRYQERHQTMRGFVANLQAKP